MANGKTKFFAFVLAALALGLGAFLFLNKDAIEFPLKTSLEYEEPYIVRDYGGFGPHHDTGCRRIHHIPEAVHQGAVHDGNEIGRT